MSDLRDTERRWRFRLPHWEVKGATFFITIRCSGSLPEKVVSRIREIRASMEGVESESEQHLALQRQLFLTCEKYLDTGYGFSPFVQSEAAVLLMRILDDWAEEAGWTVPVFCVMPNHVHFLGGKKTDDALGLKEFVKRLKGRSSRELNLLLGRSGAFWHPDWFDRWMRTEAECERVVEYILSNPVKAGLVSRFEDYAFLRGGAVAG